MVPQKDPDSQDVQERDKRQQIQTKELQIRYEVKNFFPLRMEIQQTFYQWPILPGSLYKHYLRFTSC